MTVKPKGQKPTATPFAPAVDPAERLKAAWEAARDAERKARDLRRAAAAEAEKAGINLKAEGEIKCGELISVEQDEHDDALVQITLRLAPGDQQTKDGRPYLFYAERSATHDLVVNGVKVKMGYPYAVVEATPKAK